MEAGFLALPVAFAAALVAGPSFAQLAQKPVYPRQGLFGSMVVMPSFDSFRDFYANILARPRSRAKKSHASAENPAIAGSTATFVGRTGAFAPRKARPVRARPRAVRSRRGARDTSCI
jgi:hypothetical protein